ncbi:MAG TPA: ThiF family adenylyltransferase [Marisediminicola sp.]|jgi:adenylyltransferase/sulfurtransferase|nr:ThiF family adenylyltransferase [Marisediminicola sp.]
MGDALRIHGPHDRNARLALLDGWWDRDVVRESRVGVVGIGALGNEILKNLALLDFRKVVLFDKDTVEMSNLSRSVMFRASNEGDLKVAAAAASLVELNPDVEPEAIPGDVMFEVGLGRLRELDVVIAGLDSRHVRWWLNRTARALGVPWVEGATEGAHGHAMPFLPDVGPCYECSFTDLDWAALDQVASCRQLQLDASAQGRVATSPTMASIIGGAQVHFAMDLLHGRALEGGRSLLFNLAAPDLLVSGRRENPECDAHFAWSPIMETDLASRSTVGELVALGAGEVGAPCTIELRWDLVWELRCYDCNDTTTVRRPRGLVKFSDAVCPKCRGERIPALIHRLDAETHGEFRLEEVGIPTFDIIEVRGPRGSVWLELTGDRRRESSAGDEMIP